VLLTPKDPKPFVHLSGFATAVRRASLADQKLLSPTPYAPRDGSESSRRVQLPQARRRRCPLVRQSLPKLLCTPSHSLDKTHRRLRAAAAKASASELEGVARGRSEDGEPDPRSAQTRLSKLVKSFLRKAGGLDMNGMVLAAIGHDGVAIKPRLDNRLKPLETLAITAPRADRGSCHPRAPRGRGRNRAWEGGRYLRIEYICSAIIVLLVTVYHVFVHMRKHGLAADSNIFNPGQTF